MFVVGLTGVLGSLRLAPALWMFIQTGKLRSFIYTDYRIFNLKYNTVHLMNTFIVRLLPLWQRCIPDNQKYFVSSGKIRKLRTQWRHFSQSLGV